MQIKTTIRAMRNQFGKLNGQYLASLCGFEYSAQTKDDAIRGLADQLERLERNQYTRPYLVTSAGTVFSLYYTFMGWNYDIIHAETGNVQPSSCQMNCATFADAFNAMKRHWEQMEADCKTKTQSIAA